MSAHESAISNRLAAQIATLTAGINLFLGPPADADRAPREAVYCLDTGGPVNVRYCGVASDYRVHSVQVYVRSEHYAREDGHSLAQLCFDALHGATIAGYMSCMVREAGPVYLGEDERACHAWSINVSLERTT